MAVTSPLYVDGRTRESEFDTANAIYQRSSASAVSWGAIAAGATAAAALSLILLILGTGLGFASVSPWYRQGMDATSFTTSTIVWLTATQLLASAMGGYLAGRLRTKWVETHSDEVYFRDTAHGFLAWALASLVTAAVLTSAIGAILSGGLQAGASVVGGAARAATTIASEGAQAGVKDGDAREGFLSYFIDTLFRRDASQFVQNSPELMAPLAQTNQQLPRDLRQVTRIFTQVGGADALPPADVRYVGQLVAQHTGLAQQEAEQRVSETYAQLQAKLREAEIAAKQLADEARKASAYGALWLFVALLAGAFVASLAATFGGRSRDA